MYQGTPTPALIQATRDTSVHLNDKFQKRLHNENYLGCKGTQFPSLSVNWSYIWLIFQEENV